MSQAEDEAPILEKDEIKRRRSSRRLSSVESMHCPTCQGIGRIRRGQESKLVAVIPCNDQRLKPRHTKLYVGVSVGLCLVVSSVVLFFLFPRSVLLSPVSVLSSYVYFLDNGIQINITNSVNITNQNFVGVRAFNLTVQAQNYDTIVGAVAIRNVTFLEPLSAQTISFVTPVKLMNSSLTDYCKRDGLAVHILYLHLQMSMTVYYLVHYEQLTVQTYEYIDCGRNHTKPVSAQHPPTLEGGMEGWMDGGTDRLFS